MTFTLSYILKPKTDVLGNQRLMSLYHFIHHFELSSSIKTIRYIWELWKLQKNGIQMLKFLMPLPPHSLLLQGVKEHKCRICGREFTLLANMKRHVLIHTNIRAYQCHMCFKSFVQKQTLKAHMIVHSDIKPYKCKVGQILHVRKGSLLHVLAFNSSFSHCGEESYSHVAAM